MEFFEKISKQVVKTYNETTDKTGKIAKETKNKFKISNLKNEIIDVYEKIGKRVYESYKLENKKDISQELIIECINIDEINEKIKILENEVLEMKHKKKCINCFTQIKDTDKYCSNCGKIQDIENENQVQRQSLDLDSKELDTVFIEKDISESENITQIEPNTDRELKTEYQVKEEEKKEDKESK